MFVVVVLYCVQLFFGSKKIQNHSLLSFSFPLLILILFSFLLSWLHSFGILRNAQFPKIYDALLKPNKKNSIQTIFQGGSPWATLVLNSVFVVVVLYCVQCFFGSKHFPKSLSPFLFLSFAIAFVSYLVQFSWHPLLGFYGVSMGFWQNFYGNSM